MADIKNIKNVTLGSPPNRIIPILTGQRFEMLTVISYLGRAGKKRAYSWLCRCDCGDFTAITYGNLVSGNSKNCGCLNNARIGKLNLAHGMAHKSSEYNIWKQMRGRCNTPTNKRFADYGGRGISICERWDDFENFLADMGERPSKKHTLERVKNNGNYEPDNCIWATKAQQNNNKRSNHRVTINGRTLNITQWAKEVGISKQVIYHRIRQGMSPEEAITKPKQDRYY